MTKRFCDLCGELAMSSVNYDFDKPFGESWHGYKAESGGSVCDGPWQPKINVRLSFVFSERQDGFGGPPDLCVKCRYNLVAELLEKIKP